MFKKLSKCPQSSYTKISVQNLLLSLQLYWYFIVLVFWKGTCSYLFFLIQNSLITQNVESVWYIYLWLIHFLDGGTCSMLIFWLSGSFSFCGVLCTVLCVLHGNPSSLDLADVLCGLWSDFAFSWYVSDYDYSNWSYLSWQAFVSWIVFLMLFL